MATIIDQISAAVNARKGSLVELRNRINEMLECVPVGTVLKDAEGEVCRMVRVVCGGSQWSNRTWDSTLTGKGALTPAGKLGGAPFGGRLICERVEDFHDGSNWIYRQTRPALSEGDEFLVMEPGTRTRELAARLPAAIARYMDECHREVAANDSVRLSL